ncbi:hypothetical protein BV22DRAFT_1124161 [Leucogyrophana mollusca]|uniref:Uncharacterized protein n=1 Tax=Leucogyrophana mollusca TaxID=85980 RepID=A0ACB8C1N8_9AGAM|nr:hypothetical protein BV22DRAFT_1124161 [Leucogyrophana mollusca]
MVKPSWAPERIISSNSTSFNAMFISQKAVVLLLAAVTSAVAKKEHNCDYTIPLKKDATWALETFTGTECR